MHKRSRRYTDALTVGVASARSDARQEDGQTNWCKDELTGAQTNRERQQEHSRTGTQINNYRDRLTNRRNNKYTDEKIDKRTNKSTDG